jgi:hypothetical protein
VTEGYIGAHIEGNGRDPPGHSTIFADSWFRNRSFVTEERDRQTHSFTEAAEQYFT